MELIKYVTQMGRHFTNTPLCTEAIVSEEKYARDSVFLYKIQWKLKLSSRIKDSMLRRSTNKPNGNKSNKDIAVPGISRVLVVFATSTRKYQELRRRLLSAIFIIVNGKYWMKGENFNSQHWLLSGKIISLFYYANNFRRHFLTWPHRGKNISEFARRNYHIYLLLGRIWELRVPVSSVGLPGTRNTSTRIYRDRRLSF